MVSKDEWFAMWGYTPGTPEADTAWAEKQAMNARQCNMQIIGDITPYRSVIDGSVITSRSAHRNHLRDHGCIEVGNEKLDSSNPNNATMDRAGRDILRAMEQAR